MTGIWSIKINGEKITEDHPEYGEFLKHHMAFGRMEGISVAYVIDWFVGKLQTGDKLLIDCELME